MSAESEKVTESFADQLASFDDRLNATSDDVDMLTDIQEGIGNLLASSGGSESDIRRVLQERYEAGELRKETFQLVKSMLDRFVTEKLPTSPTPEEDLDIRPDPPLSAPEDPPEFAATQKIDMDQVMVSDDIREWTGDSNAANVRQEFAAEAASIPMTTDFDPLADDEPENAEVVPDIRSVAEHVADEPADDKFSATTVIQTDVLKEESADMRVQVGSLLRDRFLLHEKVSGGSMGVVYKAMDRRLAEAGDDSHWVAIKVLSPELAQNREALRALQQEAAKGRCLVHPNIVRFIDLDREDDLYFIIMEWLEGRTLADILDSEDRNSIDNEAAFRIVHQVGDALAYAHSCGIVHADVKPGNIMVMPNGDARLFDFGVARVQQSQGEGGFDPGVLGAMTPAYSSMQVLTGEEPVPSDDVFSLGCLLYRLVAGYRVFGPRNAAEASQAAMKPQRVNGFTDGQWSALKKALSYSRVTRFESVAEFLEALEESSDETMSFEAPERFVETEDSGSGRWVGLLVLLAIVAGVGAWQQGYLDRWLGGSGKADSSPVRIRENDTPTLPEPAVEAPVINAEQDAVEATQPEEKPAEPVAEALEEVVVETGEPAAANQARNITRVGPVSPLVDFSTLPEPTLIVPVATRGPAPETLTIAIREDSTPAIIDLVRDGDLGTELTVRLEEVGFSGNRSPWAGGQYALSDSGLVRFPVGQARGRITLTMAPDTLNESDQQSTLRVRDINLAGSELAVINVVLEDDDRRAFEASLPPNTIAFPFSQTSISETDPAVQLDLVRLNPDDTPVVASFSLEDITATEGQDYFAPGAMQVSFGPRQRTARVLIPLVQDSLREGDEAFVVKLDQGDDISPTITRNVLVRILDDEPQTVE